MPYRLETLLARVTNVAGHSRVGRSLDVVRPASRRATAGSAAKAVLLGLAIAVNGCSGSGGTGGVVTATNSATELSAIPIHLCLQ